MIRNRIYYEIKPFIPRSVQILVRRAIVRRRRQLYSDVWPIDAKAYRKPEAWRGWPSQKQFAFVLLHDVDSEVGQSKCRRVMELDEAMGVRSLFSFVPEGYQVCCELREELARRGFEVGVHGLKHDGKLFVSRKKFNQQAIRINQYLKEWNAVGFVSPSMHRNLAWIKALNIEYDVSTFDTDPFEPEPEGVQAIFPFVVHGYDGHRGYIELPYTMPQDFTLFVLMKEANIDIWKKKLDWIVENGGMAFVITHPDYMNANGGSCTIQEYPIRRYEELLEYIREKYCGQFWNPLPREMAEFWKAGMSQKGQQEHRDGTGSARVR